MSLRQFYHGYHIVLRSHFHINAELTFNVFHPINTIQIVLVKLASLPLKLVQTVRVIRRMSYKKQVLLSLRVNFGSPNLCLLLGSVLRIFLYFCVAVCVFVFVIYLVCTMLPVSLVCPFMIAPSGSSTCIVFIFVYTIVCQIIHSFAE